MRFKEILKWLGSIVLIVLIIFVVYAYSYFTGGPLTTAESCTGLYLSGDYSVKDVKKNCPNLAKEDLKQFVKENYSNDSDKNVLSKQEELLKNIDNEF